MHVFRCCCFCLTSSNQRKKEQFEIIQKHKEVSGAQVMLDDVECPETGAPTKHFFCKQDAEDW